MKKKISTALVSVNHNYSLDIASRLENIDKRIQYAANTSSLSGIEVSFKGLTLAYLTTDGFSEEQIEKKGKTSYEDLRGGLFLGKEDQWVLLGYYNRYKGFYVDNTPEVDPLAPLYIQRKDIETFNAGGALMYIFEPKSFSAAAAYVQSAQQKKSGGSLLAMLSFDANHFSGEADFIPDSYQDNFGEQRDLTKGEVATASLSLGYSYTLVLWEVLFVNRDSFIWQRSADQKI